jgi:serine/threonine protein kinase
MQENPMARATSDRNLLFGILALQMDFVRRDALIAAMHAWVLNKVKPLGQILMDQGALSGERHALLQALVQEHLRLHGDDAEKSLAALGGLGSAHRELRQIGDADLQASLAHVAAADPGDPYGTCASVGTSTSSGTRFRIVRPHARGGLGEIFVAHDHELHREVALKEIQDRHADHADSRARFLLEAEITGGLEHPGIVPVYGLGQYADGRPFYAMRFIRGDSLKEAIERFHRAETSPRDGSQRTLALRDLIGRFIDVCNAIAYAHSRGILHRDLKPGNIMLGKYGETLVVDWGLAKPMERPGAGHALDESPLQPPSRSKSGETVAGAAVGTPGFMSPEQAAGRLELLGPASDVYSLGATLYCLLTGRPPFAGEHVGDVLRDVQLGKFLMPRQIKPDVPLALQAICLKAMALQPADRYGSTRALAEDLEHWLADEPVTAYREPPLMRLGRWARRHKPAVACILAVIVCLVPTLLTATLLIEREKNRAEDNFRTAQKQRERAERNFRLAQQAVDRFYTEVSESRLLNERGLQPLRRSLLETARDFYRQFVEERGDDPHVQGDLGKALFRLAYLTDDIESKVKAIALYQEALATLEPLCSSYPEERSFQSYRAASYLHLASLYRYTGRPDLADTALQKALELYEPLARADGPDALADQRALATAYQERGYRLYDTGHRAQAIEFLQRALAVRQRCAEAHPAAAEVQSDLAMSHNRFGRLYQEQGDPRQALAAHRQACAIRERLVHDQPTVSQYASDLAWSYHHMGRVLVEIGQVSDALQNFDLARRLRERLVDDNPAVMEFRCDLAFSYHDSGLLQESIGNRAEGLALLERACKIRQRLVDDQPIVTDYQSDLAWSHYHIGCWQRRAGLNAEAATSLEKAREILEPLLARANNPSLIRAKLAACHAELGRIREAAGEPEAAVQSLEHALDIQEALVAADPAVADWKCQLAGMDAVRGRLQHDLGLDGQSWTSKARQLFQGLADEYPDRVDFAAALTELLRDQALQEEKEGVRLRDCGAERLTEAMRLLRAAAERDEMVVARAPEIPAFRQALTDDHSVLTRVQRELEQLLLGP